MSFSSSRTPREGNVERQNVTDIARRQMTIVVIPNAPLPRLIEWFFLVQYECGHVYSDFGYCLHICAYGHVINVEGTHARCPDCAMRHIRKKHCRCNACGHPILPESDVAVTPISRRWESVVGSRTATLWTPFGLSVINCTRPECLGIGATGFWDGDAYRPHETRPSFQTEIGRAPLIRPDEWREDSTRPKR